MVSASARRAAARYAIGRGLSQRRACFLAQVSRSILGYKSVLEVQDREPTRAIRDLARQYPRFGDRRIRILLARDGFPISTDRAWRLWQKAGGPAGPEETAPAQSRILATETPAGGGPASGLGVIRVRSSREWPATKVHDRDRRVHQGMPFDPGGWTHPVGKGRAGAQSSGEPPRRTASRALTSTRI